MFEPKQMDRDVLDWGVAWVQREFYSRRRIGIRISRCMKYLSRDIIFRAILPVNLGYRQKMAIDGTFTRGVRFNPAI